MFDRRNYHDRKLVYAKLVRPGDIVCETQKKPADERWTVTEVRLGATVQVRYKGWGRGNRWVGLGAYEDRVWVDRPVTEN